MKTQPSKGAHPVLIVGIGASAGGVEALGLFFDAMPADSGAAFVVVLHLDPTRESQMAHVLASHTAMPVVQVADEMNVAPGHVYVIAPDNDLRVRGGALHLSEPAEPRGHRHPVDVLFRSLAEDQGERTIAIVLSGTGSNGTDGLKEVKAAGGLVLVQEPATAKFDGMPRSAIAAGMADHILAPEAMPEVLQRYLHHDYIAANGSSKIAAPQAQGLIDQILTLLRTNTAHDFRGYKRTTLQRRIQRRLGLKNVTSLTEYLNLLRANPEETALLAKDLMINVTGFFRDPEAWKALADLAIAPMIAARDSGTSIRAWVPGCSTGEEAYTLAMLLSEQAAAAGKEFDVSIFATDARDDNLRTARDGVYPQAAVANLEQARQRRFFDKLDGSSQVKKELRSMVVFAPQNLLRDPPFSRLDLVSCRNLLIYLDAEAQQRIIALCHFALREGGHLLLGNTETVGRLDALFEPVSKKWRIYRRLGPTRHDIVNFPVLGAPARSPKAAEGRVQPPPAEIAVAAAEMARRILLERFAPASVLIDRDCRVLYFHGATGDYLEQPAGQPTTSLFAMAREGLAAKLRGAVREVHAENRGVTVKVRVRNNGTNRQVVVTVTPVPTAATGAGTCLVSFEPVPSAVSVPRQDVPETFSGEHLLQEDLKAARSELQANTESLEATNEEMKASNEEITSMNEELQSTNEELETSKEELQSFNEELHTVNNQLQHKVRELEDNTNDLNNLLAGTDTATLFLDTNLCIKWFAPATVALFDLKSSDIGRPISHFARKFDDENLLSDAEKVLQKLKVVESEVPSRTGRWYLRRMLPYRTGDNRIVGVVVTFIDVTGRKRATDDLNNARIYAVAIVDTVRQPLLVLDKDLRVVSANPAFRALFQVSEAEMNGLLVYEMGNGQWDIAQLRTLLHEVLPNDRKFDDVEIEHDFRGIGHRSILLSGRKLSREGGRDDLILLAIEDITARRRGESDLVRSEAQYRTLFDSIDEGFCIIEKIESRPDQPIDFTYLEANPAFERQSGVGGVVGKTMREAFPGEPEDWFDTYDGVLRDGKPLRFERGLATKGRILELYAFRLEDAAQRRIGVIFQDITSRKRAEEHREILVRELNHRVKNSLAMVSAIASQTLGNATSLEAARHAFGARLQTVARAHDLLTHGNWSGTDLASVARATIEPHDDGKSRLSVEGPYVALTPAMALTFSLALHELCTNATKYGALSTPAGHVEIVWQVTGEGNDRRLKLRWTESGGPPVTPPERKGFGSRLIEKALAMELEGEVRIHYQPAGVVCMIDAPLPSGKVLMEPDVRWNGDGETSFDPGG